MSNKRAQLALVQIVIFLQDTDSQISSGSKPNSNGYNVRFGPDTKPDPSELAEAKQQHMAQVMQQMMHDQVKLNPFTRRNPDMSDIVY